MTDGTTGEGGDPAAMTRLARTLLHQGDAARAEHWYARAAAAGDREAMTGLGNLLHRTGRCDEAARWWRLAAAAGEPQAMRNLAETLRAKDPAQARRWHWFADAAERDVTSEVVPDEVGAVATGLGPLRSVAGRTEPESTVGCLIAGAAVGAVLAGIGLLTISAASTTGWGIGLLITAGLVALLTATLVIGSRNRVSVRVWRFEDGLVLRDPKGRLLVLRWTEIQVLRSTTDNYVDGRFVGIDISYTLVHRDGRRIWLGDIRAGELCVLGDAIERRVAAVRLPGALGALRAGNRLRFGELAVDLDGISDGGARLPWHEVEAVETVDGWIRVRRAGRSVRWSRTRVRDIPDVMLFLVLVDALRTNPGALG